MKVIYTSTLPLKLEAGVCYRTAFMGVISGATSVEVDEDFPDADLVDQAYAFLDTQPTSETPLSSNSMKLEIEELQTTNTNLTTDLQSALDAKDQVQAKLTETESQLGALQTENTELKAKIAEMEKAAVKKPTAAELKAAKAAEEAKVAEQSQE